MARNFLTSQAQPSFKGVKFYVDRDTVGGGRSIVVHEYPNSEFWDNEDVGRKLFRIVVDGYVVGDDVDDQAQALLAACTSPGSGLLVLPARPQQTARCESVTSDWIADAMGRMDVHMEFVAESRQAGGIVPAQSTMLANDVAISADQGSDVAVSHFSGNFNSIYRSFSQPTAVPTCARLAAAVTIGMAAEALAAAIAAVGIVDPLAAAQVRFGARQIRENATLMAEQGGNAYRIDQLVFVDDAADTQSAFGRVFADTLRLLTRNAADPIALAAALLPLTVFAAQTLANVDPAALTVRAELALTADVASFVRQVALIRWAQAISRGDYRSRAEATNAKAMLAPAFADEIAAAPNPDVADALRRILGLTAQYLTRNGAQLPRTILITTARGIPAAALAAMLYNDASRDEELWRRNGVENHPLMLPESVEALAPRG